MVDLLVNFICMLIKVACNNCEVFEDGKAKDQITWCMDVKEIFAKHYATNNASKQHQICSSLLTGSAKEEYVVNWNVQNTMNTAQPAGEQLTPSAVLSFIVNNTANKYFSVECDWFNAYCYQKAYMRKNLLMGDK